MGLGDHIICNGLIRTLILPSEEYIMFVKPHNLDTVKFMYRDLLNLSYIIGDDSFVLNFLNENRIQKKDIIIIGFEQPLYSKSFDEGFYIQHNIPFEYRWSKFKVNRDFESEKILFDKFNVKENEYVFIHDDNSRGYSIDENLLINKELPILRPKIGLTLNSFDYCYLMEHSKEAHFIDSSFRLIFDSLCLKNENIFYHLKLKNGLYRNTNEYNNSVSKLKFTIID